MLRKSSLQYGEKCALVADPIDCARLLSKKKRGSSRDQAKIRSRGSIRRSQVSSASISSPVRRSIAAHLLIR